MKETSKHQEAFNYYYSLGEKRNLTLVARYRNVTKVSVARWSKAFNWQERVFQRDLKNAERLAEQVDNEIIRERAWLVNIVRQCIDNTLKKNIEGQVVGVNIIPRTAADLEKMIKLRLLLMGEATERGEFVQPLNLIAPRSKEDLGEPPPIPTEEEEDEGADS